MREQPEHTEQRPQHNACRPAHRLKPCDIMPHLGWRVAHLDSTAAPRPTMSLRIPTIFFALLLCIGVNVYAQAPGRVSGRVLDQTGAVLPGVAIDLVVNSRELTAVTDDTGAYRFDAVPVGSAE